MRVKNGMRTVNACSLALVAVGTFGGVASAADCRLSSPDVLKIESWEASPRRTSGATVTMVLRNVGERPIEMVDATAWFRGELGEGIGGIYVSRDAKIDAGSTFTQTSNMVGFGRLVTVDKKFVHALACAKAVLYRDGTKERFDE